jgi:hypothetical protein
MPPPRGLVAICAVLAVCGMARIVYVEARIAPTPSRIDARYAEIRPLMPDAGVVSFLTDERFARELDSKRYTQALYALAPVVLILNDRDADIAIADVEDPPALAGLAAGGGFEVSWIADGGAVALLRRGFKP